MSLSKHHVMGMKTSTTVDTDFSDEQRVKLVSAMKKRKHALADKIIDLSKDDWDGLVGTRD